MVDFEDNLGGGEGGGGGGILVDADDLSAIFYFALFPSIFSIFLVSVAHRFMF